MTVIVPQPSHIGLPTLPPPQLDIAYSSASCESATPRAVLAHAAIDIVAAAVSLAPALSPALPPENPDYCLSSKRKAVDDDALDEARSSKRPKSEDDVVFGLLSDAAMYEAPCVAVNTVDPMQAAIDQAVAAIFSCASSEPVSSAPAASPQTCEPAQSSAVSSRIPQSPLAIETNSASFDSPEALTSLQRPLARQPVQPRNRMTEPPLWKVACRTRVDHIMSVHGVPAVRATVAQEDRLRTPRSTPKPKETPARRSWLEPSSDELELKIYTPLTFTAPSPPSDKEVESKFPSGDDMDMSFDLDSDSDSDTDSDTGEDEDWDTPSSHETVFEISVSETNTTGTSGSLSSLVSTTTIPPAIAIPCLPSIWPPRLPRLSNIPVYCLREYPTMDLMGTPAKNSDAARGSLSRLCAPGVQSQKSSDSMCVVV